MNIQYFISGGELRIDKKCFIREMLRPESVMKHLLNYTLEDHGKTRSLQVDKSAADQVVVSFNFVDSVEVGEDYQKLLENLKHELQERIKGRIALAIITEYTFASLMIDFNSDDGTIRQQLA